MLWQDHMDGVVDGGFVTEEGRALETYILALWNSRKIDLDLRLCENICRSGHVDEEICSFRRGQHLVPSIVIAATPPVGRPLHSSRLESFSMLM